jgi:diguanylate cyclase (GGDEF)-like protein
MVIRRTLFLIAFMLAALIGGTLAAVKVTVDHLLYVGATQSAQRWARHLTENVGDLEQIAAGEQPSNASMAFFQGSLRSGYVFRYEIFNRDGYSQLRADQQRIAPVDVSEFRPEAAAAAKTGTISVAVTKSDSPDFPAFYGEAYVPVIVDGNPIAVVAAYVDQTEDHARYFRAFLLAAAGLCALTSLAFLVPAAAWYRRTVEKDRAHAEARFLANHDPMTRFANRAHLAEQLNAALAWTKRTNGQLAVHYLDLDNFKGINDELGHQTGDAVLRLMSDRIRAATRREDIVARMGGDEFVIVQTGLSDKHAADKLAQRLTGAMSRPFVIDGHSVHATASIGIALSPHDGQEADQLVRVADLALYKSKSAGRNCHSFFTPEMDAEIQARRAIEARIREAAQNDEFELRFQPLVDIMQGQTVGYEALLRLHAADGTPIPPSEFVPIAEQIGLIGKIGAWAIREACRAAAAWPGTLTVAVNLSPAQFDGTTGEVVRAALDESGLAPARLQLEITESLLMEDTEAVIAELTQLKALGVAIVMDDFGTGFSSLSYLWRFPFNKIKIDRSFMQNLDSADRSIETIMWTMINLGHMLGMRVTVEGVENQRQLDLVRRFACDEVQGFHLGHPIPAEEIALDLLATFPQILRKVIPEARPPLQLVG